MMIFNTIEEIIKEFELESNEIPEIKKELQELLKIVHSGKNEDGKFSDKIAELTYPKIMSALEFLKSETLPVSKTELAKIIKEITPYSNNPIKTDKLEKQINTEIKNFKRSGLIPKISTSAITIILSFIWFFPSKVLDHPILSNFVKPTDWIFTLIWVLSMVITGLVWLITKRKERMVQEGIKKLNIESVQNSILSSFLSSKEYSAKKENKTYITFSKDELVEYFSDTDIRKLERVYYFRNKISTRLKRYINQVFGLEETIDIEIAQSLAEILTERLLSKKVVVEILEGNISSTYRKKIKIADD